MSNTEKIKATAIYVKTESGDDYLYCTGELTDIGLVKYLRTQLGSEFGDISIINVDTMGYDGLSLDMVFEAVYAEDV